MAPKPRWQRRTASVYYQVRISRTVCVSLASGMNERIGSGHLISGEEGFSPTFGSEHGFR